VKAAERRYADHLDWHFRQNQKLKSQALHGNNRQWYIKLEVSEI